MDAKGMFVDPKLVQLERAINRLTRIVHAKQLCRLFVTQARYSAKRIRRPRGTRAKVVDIVESVAEQIEALDLGLITPTIDLGDQFDFLQGGLTELNKLFNEPPLTSEIHEARERDRAYVAGFNGHMQPPQEPQDRLIELGEMGDSIPEPTPLFLHTALSVHNYLVSKNRADHPHLWVESLHEHFLPGPRLSWRHITSLDESVCGCVVRYCDAVKHGLNYTVVLKYVAAKRKDIPEPVGLPVPAGSTVRGHLANIWPHYTVLTAIRVHDSTANAVQDTRFDTACSVSLTNELLVTVAKKTRWMLLWLKWQNLLRTQRPNTERLFTESS